MRFPLMPSSVILDFTYSPLWRALTIDFTTGRTYVYFDVPEDEVRAFEAAESRGRYFNAHIRDAYRFREVRKAG